MQGLIPQFLHLKCTKYVWGLWLLWEGKGAMFLFQCVSSELLHNFPGHGVERIRRPSLWPGVADVAHMLGTPWLHFSVCAFWFDLVKLFCRCKQWETLFPLLICHNFSFSDFLLVVQSCLMSPFWRVWMVIFLLFVWLFFSFFILSNCHSICLSSQYCKLLYFHTTKFLSFKSVLTPFLCLPPN